jgi:hypothetical protein
MEADPASSPDGSLDSLPSATEAVSGMGVGSSVAPLHALIMSAMITIASGKMWLREIDILLLLVSVLHRMISRRSWE